MKLVIYAGSEYLTGDEIAEALMAYSAALGATGNAERVTIPIRERDGADSTAEFLLGPASQIVVKPVETGDDELVDEYTVAHLRELTLRIKRTIAGESADFWI